MKPPTTQNHLLRVLVTESYQKILRVQYPPSFGSARFDEAGYCSTTAVAEGWGGDRVPELPGRETGRTQAAAGPGNREVFRRGTARVNAHIWSLEKL